MLSELSRYLAPVENGLRKVSDFIYTNPEIALKEYKAQETLTAFLQSLGYSVRMPLIEKLPTSFLAEAQIGTGEGTSFAFFSEYDALSGIGHACGHNLIAVSGLAAFHQTVEYMKAHHPEFNGRVLLFGTPAEEGYSGKVDLAEKGVFTGVNAGVISHPYDRTSMDDGALSAARYRIYFHGRASHAGLAPEKGINALTSMVQFFQMLGVWRQQLPEAARVHGIITHGGDAANVIPAETAAYIYLRSPSMTVTDEMRVRLESIVRGAADVTGCTYDIEQEGNCSAPCLVNQPLNEAYRELMTSLGENVRFATGTEGRISTDFGDVSQAMPGVNVHFGICENGEDAPLHTEALKQAAGTDFAFNQAMKCSSVMAAMAIRYFTDASFRIAVDQDFRKKKN